MDLSALSEQQRQQAEDIQRRFQEHQHQQNSAQQYHPQQEQGTQVQSYYHSNQASDQPYQPYGDYYQYQHHYYQYQHPQQPAPISLPQNNVGSSYSQYVYYQEATPVNPPAPAVAIESAAHVGYISYERPPHSEVNPTTAGTVESTAHIGYNYVDRAPNLISNPAPAAAVGSTAQIGYSTERPDHAELNHAQPVATESMAHIGYSSVERPAHLGLNPVPPVAIVSAAHTGYSSIERPARLELNPGPSVAIESTVRIGYISTERSAQVELNPAVAAALAELNKLSETIDIAQRTAAIDMARRTAVRCHGGGSSLEHVIGHGLFNGSLHSSFGSHIYATNHLLLAGGGRGRGKNKSGKNGAFGGRHHLASRFSTSFSHGNRQGQVRTKDAHKKPSSSTNPKKAVQATSNEVKQVWRCDLCKADCNSKEILEQHESGKKHKKNLERVAEEGRISQNGPICNTSNDEHMPLPAANQEVLTSEDATAEQTMIQYIPPVKVDPWQDPPAESTPETTTNIGFGTATVEQQLVVNPSESQRSGTGTGTGTEKKKNKNKKRKKIAAVGGIKKPRIRTAPQERKNVLPLSCHVCNIRCDTQEVLNKHFAGKKHIANLKKHQGYGQQPPVYGATGLQAVYPSNLMAHSSVVYPTYQETGHLQQETQQAYYDPTQAMYYPPPQPQVTYQ